MEPMDQDVKLKESGKIFRAGGMIFLSTAALLLIWRLVLPYIMRLFPNLDAATEDIVSTAIFDFLVQIVSLLIVPFLICRFYLKKSAKEVLYISNVRPVTPLICFFSFLLGICAFIITIYVSFLWQYFLTLLGYDGSSSSPMPEKFHLWHLLLMLFLTAILPAICEEFTNRGLLITAVRGSFSSKVTVILGGVVFGLFHQYISQTVYTALMGMLLTYLVLNTRSLIPAAIVHFTNNAISVLNTFVAEYANLDFLTEILNFLLSVRALFVLVPVVVLGIAAALIGAIKKNYAKYYTDNYAAFINTGERKYRDKIECAWNLGDVRYRPAPVDYTFYIGGAVLTVVYTIFTLVWGFF